MKDILVLCRLNSTIASQDRIFAQQTGGSKGVLALDKAETALLPLSFALNDKAETALLPLSFA